MDKLLQIATTRQSIQVSPTLLRETRIIEADGLAPLIKYLKGEVP
jgi:hypothetical protein